MLTIAQVASIVGLLMAFGAPNNAVLEVQTILNTQIATTTAPAIVVAPPDTFSSAPVEVEGSSTPQVSAPTCTLEAGQIVGGEDDLAYVIWNTTNADSGKIYVQRNGQPTVDMSPIAFGGYGNPQGSGWNIGKNPSSIYTIEADIVGPGGTGSCTTSVIPQ